MQDDGYGVVTCNFLEEHAEEAASPHGEPGVEKEEEAAANAAGEQLVEEEEAEEEEAAGRAGPKAILKTR